MMPTLYVVATPIGNLSDMTPRAIDTLKSVALIAAEDTRVTKKLLNVFEIDTPLTSCHQHNEETKGTWLADKMLAENIDVAVTTDAGTPCISDPGFMLVRACVERGVEVQCLPGATAFVPALVDSGLPNDRFYFEGFLPQKKGRQTRLKILGEQTHTMIIYESPFRLVKTLEQLAEFMGGERRASVSREISKLHEDTQRGTLLELAAHYKQTPPKGEIVLIVEGKNDK